MTESDVSHGAPGRWKRNPIGLWVYIAIGAARIILSGISIVLMPGRRRA